MAKPVELWNHLSAASELPDVRGMSAQFDDSGDRRVLKLEVPRLSLAPGETVRDPRRGIAWVVIPPPAEGWSLSRSQRIQASVKNTGTKPAQTTLWVVSSNGWSAVGGAATLKPNQMAMLICSLRGTYPDKTPKVDPGRISEIRVMVQRTNSASIEVSGLLATGTTDEWVRPAGRLDVPEMVNGKPAPGRRVRYQLADDRDSGVYCALYLPSDWEPGKRYPVIAEYPGNIFFSAKACWSTGRPEQCAMGYGVTSGTNAIWVSLPFVDRPNGEIAEAGFGSNDGDDTAAYAMAVIDDICTNWGGDWGNLFLCGFSRGAIACGYIGLSNDKIAGLWKGFVACQHYDGSRWRQSKMEEAVERAPRFRGKAIFQVDNRQAKYQPVVDATDPSVKWTWARSGLGYHATAMFLDNRPCMKQLRQWFANLTGRASALSAGADEAMTPVDVSVLPKGAERVDIFLLMGQSNMKGRGRVPPTQPRDPLILNMNLANDQWYVAQHPLHKAGVPDLIDGSDNAGVGPGLAFARELRKRDDRVLIALVPLAQGGSWINLWKRGSKNYSKTIRRARKALTDFPPGKARVAGSLWLQGESDTLEARYGVYSDKLIDLVRRLRADLGDPDLPFIACTIGSFIKPKGRYLHVKEINEVLLRLPERLPHTACVDARDLQDGHIGDFMHYDTAAQEAIGKRYAAEHSRLTERRTGAE